MPKVQVSVIVPVYNVDRFLRQCIDSVVGQSLQAIEIIAINDASTDTSGAILSEFSVSDNRVKVINLEVNGGVSTARNIGVETAVGDYIIFLDGDDFWTNGGMLQDLYDRCEEEQLDLIEFGIYRPASESEQPPRSSGQSKFVFLQQEINWTVSYNICAKLIARELLQTNQIRFDADLVVGEDALFSLQLYCHAERLAIYDRIYYFYRTHPQSVNSLGWNRNKLFCTVRWFELGIEAVKRHLPLGQRKHVLQSIANERLKKLLHRLGPVALDVLDEHALSDYVECWSRCLAAIDHEFMSSEFMNHEFMNRELMNYESVERDLLLGADAGLIRPLLDAVRRNDVRAFQAFFESAVYGQGRIHNPGVVTLTQEQGVTVAQSILLSNSESILCNFGGGVFVTLPRVKAHQLASQLHANRQPTITLRFKL